MHGEEKVGSALQIVQRQLEEQGLVGQSLAHQRFDRRVVVGTLADGLFENCRIGSEAGDRQLGDHLLQPAAVQHVARDVVDPQALAGVVQLLRRLHGVLSNCRLGGAA